MSLNVLREHTINPIFFLCFETDRIMKLNVLFYFGIIFKNIVQTCYKERKAAKVL